MVEVEKAERGVDNRLMDKTVTIEELKTLVKKFNDDRDWSQFHNAKDLAAAIGIEAGELQEKFLWKTKEQVAELMASAKRSDIEDELADILSFVICLANAYDVDLSDHLKQKYEKSALKYPVDKSKGRADKYNEL